LLSPFNTNTYSLCIMHYQLCIGIAHTFSCKLRVVSTLLSFLT
jgi:hypothetical protein